MSAGSVVADGTVIKPAEAEAATDTMPEIPPLTVFDYCDGNAGFKAADTALYPDQLIPSERARYRVEVSPGKFIDLCPNHYRRHETVFAAAGYRTLAADSN
jgi:hypothetical protein